ncbi:cold-shock protein [Stutzerimonas stutzeri]|uniref:cold-shock protein n=1 Tax=Stutzerimonas stutzeri TaxID=316 RepID=UPI0003968AD7|nr:cold shock domain-containing protein [Stutzerimonas stutzeri]EQM75052.1 cold-shock protein [Stutzerimonas stutzeri MF28]
MLKIIHVLTGVVALALSFVPSLTGAMPLLVQPGALCLLFLGLLNVQFASSAQANSHARSHPVLVGTSVLLIVAVVIQAAILLLPVVAIAGQPATLASLVLAFIAVLLQLATTQSSDTRTANRSPSSHRRSQHKNVTAPAAGAAREAGTVKWFNTSKGFGFISRDSGDDVFVHFRAIRGEGHRVLVEGQRVEFTIMMRDKGLQAEDVVPSQSTI